MDTHHSQAAPYQGLSIAEICASTLLPFQQENLHLRELRNHAEQDQAYQALKLVITEGFPYQNLLARITEKIWSIKDHLSIDDDLIVYRRCLLIPTSLHATMLSHLHNAYQGIARSQARTPHHLLAWHRSGHYLSRAACHCQDHLPSNAKEPMVSKQILDRPFQQIAADFASYGGKQFLILVDCKTDWPDIIEVGKDTTRAKLTTTL